MPGSLWPLGDRHYRGITPCGYLPAFNRFSLSSLGPDPYVGTQEVTSYESLPNRLQPDSRAQANPRRSHSIGTLFHRHHPFLCWCGNGRCILVLETVGTVVLDAAASLMRPGVFPGSPIARNAMDHFHGLSDNHPVGALRFFLALLALLVY